MGTEEHVQTAKVLIEEFISQQMSGLSCLKHYLFYIFFSFESMHSKIVILSFVNRLNNVSPTFIIRLFVRPSVSLQAVCLLQFTYKYIFLLNITCKCILRSRYLVRVPTTWNNLEKPGIFTTCVPDLENTWDFEIHPKNLGKTPGIVKFDIPGFSWAMGLDDFNSTRPRFDNHHDFQD